MTGIINHFPASEYALLGFLYPGPSHGYELHKKMTDSTGIALVWGVKMANLYAQLTKLEHKGFIQGKVQPQEQHPSRKLFSLTRAGNNEFQTWLHQLVEHPRNFRQDFMVKFFFLSQYEPESVQGFCQSQLSVCEKWAQVTREKTIDSFSFESSIYNFRYSQIMSMIDWLNWVIAKIKP